MEGQRLADISRSAENAAEGAAAEFENVQPLPAIRVYAGYSISWCIVIGWQNLICLL